MIETQLKREERLEAFEDERNLRRGNVRDIERAEWQESGNEGGPQSERMQVLSSLVTTGAEELAASSLRDSCQGSLRNLVKISKDLDRALQQILGQNYLSDGGTQTPSLPRATPSAIVDYLEKEEGNSNLYPSISRDITSTSSIHRQTIRPIIHGQRDFMDPRSSTFHGTSDGAVDDGSQIKITAWPTSATSTLGQQTLRPGRRPTLPTSSPSMSRSSSIHQRNRMNTTEPVQWRSLIEYTKQFKALTTACEEAIQKVADWEASEKRLRERRRQSYRHQKQLLQDRLKQLQVPGTPRVGVGRDHGEEGEEGEELEDWDQEGSNDDDEDEDEILDCRRSRIVASLVGPSNSGHGHDGHRASRLNTPQDEQKLGPNRSHSTAGDQDAGSAERQRASGYTIGRVPHRTTLNRPHLNTPQQQSDFHPDGAVSQAMLGPQPLSPALSTRQGPDGDTTALSHPGPLGSITEPPSPLRVEQAV